MGDKRNDFRKRRITQLPFSFFSMTVKQIKNKHSGPKKSSIYLRQPNDKE